VDRAEEVRTQDAMLDNPRREGESLVSWLERVNLAAGVMLSGQCDAIERDWREEDVAAFLGPREPGGDDE
jgi:hypothetical protein